MTEALNIASIFSTRAKDISKADDLHQLIQQCMANSRSAQKKLYDIYSPGAYGVIRRYLYNNEAAASEVLNDTFFKVFTKLDQYSGQGSFEGWIRKIVVNTVTDYFRKNLKPELNHKEVQPEDGQVEGDSVSNLSYKELLEVVNTLPQAQLAVFNLFVFENYPHKDIAGLLNITENNSRWYLNDARRRLKEKINFIMK